MQTYVLNLNLEISASQLDNIRLNNQSNEALVILRTLTGWYIKNDRKGWPNHPIVKMWSGYEAALADYAIIHLRECDARNVGLVTLPDRYTRIESALMEDGKAYFDWELRDFEYPPWLTEQFASNHRSILLGKVMEVLDEAENGLDRASMNRVSHQESKAGVKEYQEAIRVFSEANRVVKWYQQFGWPEQPAQRDPITGRWPYLWPEVV